jgi:hypothetical protein
MRSIGDLLVSNLSILSQPSSGTDEGYSRNMLCALLVPEGIIRPVVSASALTWFIRYVYFWNLLFLNNVIINKTKVLLPRASGTLKIERLESQII